MRLLGIVVRTAKQLDIDTNFLADKNDARVDLVINIKNDEIADLIAENSAAIELVTSVKDAEIADQAESLYKANLEISELLDQGQRLKELEMGIGEMNTTVQEQLLKIMQNQKARIKEIMNHA